MSKFTSRKFLISVAAFLGSIGASIAAMQVGSEKVAIVGLVCSILSAAIYAAAEAYVDASAAGSPVVYLDDIIEDDDENGEAI